MINFIIVEDNKIHRKKLKNVILNYMMKNKIEFDIIEFDRETEELNEFMKNLTITIFMFLILNYLIPMQ